MGGDYSKIYLNGTRPDHIPGQSEKPTFDPQYGFNIPRKERESKLSYQEMRALQLTPRERDYCAHKLKDYIVCFRRYTPLVIFCNKEYHEYEHCEFEDYVLRMKEYEREKRLRIRELKKKGITVS